MERKERCYGTQAKDITHIPRSHTLRAPHASAGSWVPQWRGRGRFSLLSVLSLALASGARWGQVLGLEDGAVGLEEELGDVSEGTVTTVLYTPVGPGPGNPSRGSTRSSCHTLPSRRPSPRSRLSWAAEHGLNLLSIVDARCCSSPG